MRKQIILLIVVVVSLNNLYSNDTLVNSKMVNYAYCDSTIKYIINDFLLISDFNVDYIFVQYQGECSDLETFIAGNISYADFDFENDSPSFFTKYKNTLIFLYSGLEKHFNTNNPNYASEKYQEELISGDSLNLIDVIVDFNPILYKYTFRKNVFESVTDITTRKVIPDFPHARDGLHPLPKE